jgi:XTP/dITP diphosphohydrolase
VPALSKPITLLVASSNEGKVREYRALAGTFGARVALELLPNFIALPKFAEAAPTFGENAVGKALHYSRLSTGLVIADDSGLVVPALGGAPGVHSARYAGPAATDARRIQKLLDELRDKRGQDRRARFVCVVVLAEVGDVRGVFSASAEGEVLDGPRGTGGFGYDPIFLLPELSKTFAELSQEEKNRLSHRGKAFRKALDFLLSASSPPELHRTGL